VFQDNARNYLEETAKIFFILRDFYLLTKVQVTGTIVYYIKKDDKHIFGCKFRIPASSAASGRHNWRHMLRPLDESVQPAQWKWTERS